MALTGRTVRWSAPAVAALVIAGVAAAPHVLATSGRPTLPTRTAAQLLAGVDRSSTLALSGTIETTANLGLPSLPESLAGGGSGLTALLTGTHTLRVWVDGPARQRLALLGDLAETDVIHDGRDLWTWASSTNSVTHQALRAGHDRGSDVTIAHQLTPLAQARQALAAVDPTTKVTVGGTASVAHRSAYELVVLPRTTATLVRSVRIAIDAATSVPLRVQVYAAGVSRPVWQTRFTKVSFAVPSASVFRFRPPRGAHVTNRPAPMPRDRRGAARPPAFAGDGPRVLGHGWAGIVELPAGTLDAPTARGSGDAATGPLTLLYRATTAVPEGRLLTTRLLSALITRDGRVLVGAVPGAALRQAAAREGA